MLFYNGLIISSTGEGPFWKRHVTIRYEKHCTSNWWTNLLYINNYVNPSEMVRNKNSKFVKIKKKN